METVNDIDTKSLYNSKLISPLFGETMISFFKNICNPDNDKDIIDNACEEEDLPPQVEDLIDFLQCFESTNPKVLVRNDLGVILFKGRVKDFDVDHLKDYPIPLNYEAYSADVRDDYLIINMRKIKE